MDKPTIMQKVLLLPLSKLYGFVTATRNRLFEWNILKSQEFQVPVIVVGNIAVGGTGKTPHTEYIVEALRCSYHIGVLSRGYKRATKGFVMADSRSTPRSIGDEPFQIYRKFSKDVSVAVCEDRCRGIREMLRLDPSINLIILDDAFQHRYVKPRISIVITEYARPIFKDKMLPYGRLRESAKGLDRADIVVVSKCPEGMQPIEYSLFAKNLKLYPYQKLFFSRFAYGALVPLFPSKAIQAPDPTWLTRDDVILAVSGIGNPRPFVKYIKSFEPRVKVNIFPDHHNYNRHDIELILHRFNSMKGRTKLLITTEKDAVRLSGNPNFPDELKRYAFYLPINVEFARGEGDSFIDTLRKSINKR